MQEYDPQTLNSGQLSNFTVYAADIGGVDDAGRGEANGSRVVDGRVKEGGEVGVMDRPGDEEEGLAKVQDWRTMQQALVPMQLG